MSVSCSPAAPLAVHIYDAAAGINSSMSLLLMFPTAVLKLLGLYCCMLYVVYVLFFSLFDEIASPDWLENPVYENKAHPIPLFPALRLDSQYCQPQRTRTGTPCSAVKHKPMQPRTAWRVHGGASYLSDMFTRKWSD